MVSPAPLHLILWALVGGALSGCMGAEAPAPEDEAATSASVHVSPESNTTQATGSIEGLVTDDEGQPLAKATVAILKLDAEVQTAEDGSFAFKSVPVGTHPIVAQKIGYEQAVKQVTVEADAATEVTLALVAQAIVEPYYTNLNRVAYHQFGNAEADWALHMAGVTQHCQSCVHNFKTDEPPQSILVEIRGRHTVSSPQGDAEYVYLCKGNRTASSCSTDSLIVVGNFPLPVRQEGTEDKIGKTTEFHFEALCNLYWTCFEERRDIWISVFHHMEIPEGYTAFPPG